MRVCIGSFLRGKQMEIRGEVAEVFWQPRHLSRECFECLCRYSSVAGAGDFSPYSSCFWPPPVPLPFAEVSLIRRLVRPGSIIPTSSNFQASGKDLLPSIFIPGKRNPTPRSFPVALIIYFYPTRVITYFSTILCKLCGSFWKHSSYR